MSLFWRIVLAVCAFLAALAVGTFGGCAVGTITAFSQSTTARPSDGSFYALIYVGAGVGLIMGVVLARLILKPPRPTLPPRDDSGSEPRTGSGRSS